MEMGKQMYIDDVEEASMNSSTGSNYVFIDEGLSDSSNQSNQLNFQQKADSVGYIFKRSDANIREEQRDKLHHQKIRMIEQTGPYESTAESVLRTREKLYTPQMICEELIKLGFSQDTFMEACHLLINDDKEFELFLGVPPKFRIGWIQKRVPKRKCLDIEEIPIKKRQRIVL